MKLFFRRFTALLLVLCLTIPMLPVYAEGTQTNADNISADTGRRLGANETNRHISGNKFGYKIEMFYTRDGKAFKDNSQSPGEQGGVRVSTVVSVSGIAPSANVPITSVVSEQTSWKTAMSKLSAKDYAAFGGGTYHYEDDQLVVYTNGGAGATITLEGMKGFIRPDRSEQCVNILGNWLEQGSGFAAKANKLFAEQGTDSLAGMVLSAAVGDTAGAPLIEMAMSVYSSQSAQQQDRINAQIPKNANSQEKADLLIDLCLPISDKCMVGWATYLAPLMYTYTDTPGMSILDDRFDSYLGSANNYAFVNGATKAFFAETAVTDEMSRGDEKLADAIKSTMSDPGAYDRYAEKGEFGRFLNNAYNDALPNSITPSSSRWGVPAASVSGQWSEFQQVRSAGVGLFSNAPATPPQPELCCHPAGSHADQTGYCPCGGPGSARCSCVVGCTCDPNNPPAGCDCVPPKVELDDAMPIIDEQHLSQELTKTIAGVNKDTFNVTYKPVPDGASYWGECKVTHGTRDVQVDIGGCGDPSGHAAFAAGKIKVHHCVPNIQTRPQPTTTTECLEIPYTWAAEVYHNFSARIPESELTLASRMTDGNPFSVMRSNDQLLMVLGDTLRSVTNRDGQLSTVGDQFKSQLAPVWISHRWAVDGSKDSAVLAKYMSTYETSKANTAYKNAMSKTGYSDVTELTDGSKINKSKSGGEFMMTFHIGNNDSVLSTGSGATQQVTYKPVEGAGQVHVQGPIDGDAAQHVHGDQTKPTNRTEEGLQDVTLSRTDYSIKVGAQNIYSGKTKAQAVYDKPASTSHSYAPDTWAFTAPSQVFNFYPTYEMKSDYTVGDGDNKVYMLSTQSRRFQAFDRLTISAAGASGQTVTAPWSRDAQDVNSPTMKAGNAYDYKLGQGTVTIDGYVHLIDPAFAPDASAAQAQNDAILKQYLDQFKALASSFGKDDIELYSNLANATPTSPSLKGKSGKEALTIASADVDSSGVSVQYTYLPGNSLYSTSNRTFNGQALSPGDPLGTNAYLSNNLQTGGGNKISGWYNEDFQGIIVAHLTASFTVSNLSTNYAAVHTYQSDWQTAANATAQPITNGNTTILSGKFGVGTMFKLGSISWGSANVDNVNVYLPPYEFSVRGSVFDTVQ